MYNAQPGKRLQRRQGGQRAAILETIGAESLAEARAAAYRNPQTLEQCNGIVCLKGPVARRPGALVFVLFARTCDSGQTCRCTRMECFDMRIRAKLDFI